MSRNNEQKKQYLEKINDKSAFENKNSGNIVFNFKFFRSGEKCGESFQEWQDKGILAHLNNKLKDFSNLKKIELIVNETLEIYGSYPNDSEFEQPEDLKNYDISWARFRLDGKKRLIGFFYSNKEFSNVFYVVYLDEKHRFAPSHLKHT